MAPIPVLDRVEDTVRRRSTDLVELSHAIHAEPELAFAELDRHVRAAHELVAGCACDDARPADFTAARSTVEPSASWISTPLRVRTAVSPSSR